MSDSRQVCHEEWEYDEVRGVVTLHDFAVACQACNFALHIGMAGRPDVNAEEIGIAQMMLVNAMTRDEVRILVGDAMDVWHRRNEIAWRFEINPALAARFPVVVEALRHTPA